MTAFVLFVGRYADSGATWSLTAAGRLIDRCSGSHGGFFFIGVSALIAFFDMLYLPFLLFSVSRFVFRGHYNFFFVGNVDDMTSLVEISGHLGSQVACQTSVSILEILLPCFLQFLRYNEMSAERLVVRARLRQNRLKVVGRLDKEQLGPCRGAR